VSKVLTILERTKQQLNYMKYLPKVYVLGSTNAGKSSVINAMLAAQNPKFKTSKNRKF
jgi:ribosome biogenesis GTPase A